MWPYGSLVKKSYMGPYMTCKYAGNVWIFGIYGQSMYGEVLYGTIYGTVFFLNNAVIKIDMNLHQNVIIPIFTSFIKLQLDFTKNHNFFLYLVLENHVTRMTY